MKSSLPERASTSFININSTKLHQHPKGRAFFCCDIDGVICSRSRNLDKAALIKKYPDIPAELITNFKTDAHKALIKNPAMESLLNDLNKGELTISADKYNEFIKKYKNYQPLKIENINYDDGKYVKVYLNNDYTAVVTSRNNRQKSLMKIDNLLTDSEPDFKNFIEKTYIGREDLASKEEKSLFHSPNRLNLWQKTSALIKRVKAYPSDLLRNIRSKPEDRWWTKGWKPRKFPAYLLPKSQFINSQGTKSEEASILLIDDTIKGNKKVEKEGESILIAPPTIEPIESYIQNIFADKPKEKIIKTPFISPYYQDIGLDFLKMDALSSIKEYGKEEHHIKFDKKVIQAINKHSLGPTASKIQSLIE